MLTAVEHYRYLHRFPELSQQEEKTSAYIFDALEKAGYQPQRLGKTGVIADLVTDPALPWVLLRADMDALAVTENSCVAMPSENVGVMHACGHDSHTSMLLGAAQQLAGKSLPQNIRFLFQPAEENTEGAKEMVRAGAIPENAKACFAVHVWPGVPRGQLVTRPGTLMASSDRLHLTVHGRSAHCGQQHLGADALRTAADIVAKFPAVRALAKDARTVLFCGTMHCGTAHNIVANQAELTGTMRTFLEEDCKLLKQKLQEEAEAIAAVYGTSISLEWESSNPSVYNDENLVKTLATVAENFLADAEATLIAEDFSEFQRRVPGVLLWLGTGDTPPLHTPNFFVPEELLPVGVDFWVKVANHPW